MNVESSAERAIARYSAAYRALYGRSPRELCPDREGWVIVNGARVRVRELESLAAQLEADYADTRVHRRVVISRLVTWLQKTT